MLEIQLKTPAFYDFQSDLDAPGELLERGVCVPEGALGLRGTSAGRSREVPGELRGVPGGPRGVPVGPGGP